MSSFLNQISNKAKNVNIKPHILIEKNYDIDVRISYFLGLCASLYFLDNELDDDERNILINIGRQLNLTEDDINESFENIKIDEDSRLSFFNEIFIAFDEDVFIRELFLQEIIMLYIILDKYFNENEQEFIKSLEPLLNVTINKLPLKELQSPELEELSSVQYYLGRKNYEGIQQRKNIKLAVQYFQKAADQNHADAQYYLGLCYEKGTGVEEDINKAYKWYMKSENNGSVKVKSKGKLYDNKTMQKINDPKVYLRPNIPADKLKNALASFAPRVKVLDVIVLVDDTFFGGCKDGLILTSNCIYLKELGAPPVKIPLTNKTIVNLKNKKDLYINNEKVYTFNMATEESIALLVDAISHKNSREPLTEENNIKVKNDCKLVEPMSSIPNDRNVISTVRSYEKPKATTYNSSSKEYSRAIYISLAILFGFFGGHRFYVKSYGSAVTTLILTIIGCANQVEFCLVIVFIWNIYDIVTSKKYLEKLNARE